MGTVTGYTAEKMEEIANASVVDGNVVGDNLILVTRGGDDIDAGSVRGAQGDVGPTGDVEEAPVDGVTYYRKDGVWIPVIKPARGWDIASATAFTASTTTGQDWNPAVPLDSEFVKQGDISESWMLIRLTWGGYHDSTGYCYCIAGVKISGVDHWGQVGHATSNEHQEFSDQLALSIGAGSTTLRARIKKTSGSTEDYKADGIDFFRIEYEEILF